MNSLIVVLGIVLLSVVLCCEKKKSRIPHVISKFLLSLLFVMTAHLQPRPVPAYFNYLFLGLILCLVGDVCLALPQRKAFTRGLVAFLLGHVLYIFGFSSLLSPSHWLSPAALVIVGISGMIFFWLRPYLKSMMIPVLIYILVITIMVLGAWAVFQKSTFQSSGKALILVGAICFYISDIFVARNRFIEEEYRNRLLGLPLYYSGQFMLAFSVGLLK